MKKKLVVFSGAGISAESGLKTFRNNNGLWENYNVYDVATPEAWKANPALVLEFYNERRKQLISCKPNLAHKTIANLELDYEVTVITQNIDNFHEIAGSKNIVHLHGELLKARDEKIETEIISLNKSTINIGDLSNLGNQLRPHVVWFGEEVPLMGKAISIAQKADFFIVIGTSLNVYPAANLTSYLNQDCVCYIIDPSINKENIGNNWNIFETTATNGMKKIYKILSKKRATK
jgi:NAD-dependent deacetylase